MRFFRTTFGIISTTFAAATAALVAGVALLNAVARPMAELEGSIRKHAAESYEAGKQHVDKFVQARTDGITALGETTRGKYGLLLTPDGILRPSFQPTDPASGLQPVLRISAPGVGIRPTADNQWDLRQRAVQNTLVVVDVVDSFGDSIERAPAVAFVTAARDTLLADSPDCEINIAITTGYVTPERTAPVAADITVSRVSCAR